MYSVDDFIEYFRAKSTKKNYHRCITDFFTLLYPEMKRGEVNEYSLRYLRSKPDFKQDLVRFRNSLSHRAPMGVTLNLAAVISYLNYNEVAIPNKKGIYGRDAQQPISDEHIPTNEEIARMLNYMPLQGKTLTLILASSGMRVGEALKIILDDVDLESNPVKINIPVLNTKTKRKRFTFISSEAKDSLIEWLKYREGYIGKYCRKTKARAQGT